MGTVPNPPLRVGSEDMNKKRLHKTIMISGAAMIALILLGSIANSYGAEIPILWITNLSIPISLGTYFLVKE